MQDKPSVTHWPELVFHHIYWNIQPEEVYM